MAELSELGRGVETMLNEAGLRLTRQRIALARLLFGGGDRHVTADMLHAEAVGNRISVSLATVYNTLKQFAECGLLREIAVEGAKTYLDTNTSDHQHFYFNGELTDIDPADKLTVSIPNLPEGTKIERIDILIRLAPSH
jgi:Fur family iron response transcriptional regulator